MAGGESFFLSEYSSDRGGFVTVVPGTPGAVVHRQLQGETLVLTAGSFLASSEGVDIKTKFGGVKSLFGGEGAFLLFVKHLKNVSILQALISKNSASLSFLVSRSLWSSG